MKRVRVVAAAGAVLAAVAGAAYGGGSAKPTVVGVTEKEFKLIPVPKTAKAGMVTFAVKNTGKLPHEFVVLKTKLPPGKLPTKGAKAVETGFVGRIKSFPAGQSRKLTKTLKKGKYVLLCNLPAHYQAGQWSGFTVT